MGAPAGWAGGVWTAKCVEAMCEPWGITLEGGCGASECNVGPTDRRDGHQGDKSGAQPRGNGGSSAMLAMHDRSSVLPVLCARHSAPPGSRPAYGSGRKVQGQ